MGTGTMGLQNPASTLILWGRPPALPNPFGVGQGRSGVESRGEAQKRAHRRDSSNWSLYLILQTRAETVAKIFMGRLLLGGRRANEPEDAEKVYPWFAALWLTGVDTLRSNN